MIKGMGQTWLSIETMVVCNNKIWFAERDTNGIYFYDLETKECELFCVIEKEEQNKVRLFRAMTIYKNELYLFPFSAKNAYKVNMNTKEVGVIEIEEPQKDIYEDYDADAKFLSSFVYEGRIFVIGVTYPAILEYEIATGDIIYHREWMPQIKMYLRNEDVLFRRSIMIKDKIYVPSGRGNILLIYDISNGSYELCKIGDGTDGFSSICFDGTDFWLSPIDNGSILKWNEKSKEVVLCYKIPEIFYKGKHSWNEIVFWKEYILLLPAKADMTLKFDKNKGEVLELDKSLRGISYVTSCIDGENLYMFSGSNSVLYVIDSEINTIEIVRIANQYSKESEDLEITCITENGIDTLENYLSFLISSNVKNNNEIEIETSGYEIWKEIK